MLRAGGVLAATVALVLSGAASAAPKGAKWTTAEAASSCKIIRTAAQLQAIGQAATGSYCLANDIDLSSISNFVPLKLTNGHFFGNGHTIRNLTINLDAAYVGLFAAITDSTIEDLALVNLKVNTQGNGTFIGGLVGTVSDSTGLTTISRVRLDGVVSCVDGCAIGGIVGALDGNATLTDSSSAVIVVGPTSGGPSAVGGAVGGQFAAGAAVRRTESTGRVTCPNADCVAGGLIGFSFGSVDRSSASGAVSVGPNGTAGGLIGQAQSGLAITRRSHASGAVTISGAIGSAGGLIGLLDNATVLESYSVGRVSGGAMHGGLIGADAGATTVTNSYWDTVTSGQMASIGGTGRTTAQLRAGLPAGFGPAWAITKDHSYPFLDDSDIDFVSPLATLVRFDKVFTFLPLGQLEKSNYKIAPKHQTAASLAAVYTMIARAIGNTRKINALRAATISSYWNDGTQAAILKGPVKTYAALGAFKPLGPNAKLGNTNVIGKLKKQQLVILRGKYAKPGGGFATHWMLATLYTAEPSGVFNAVVANDPWTGEQVLIDPQTRTVVTPGFPLKNFKVDGYRTVTLLNPV